ncbi:hypothetical protein [Paenibacillus sp. J2TS4]|uniref:hypothetical protein n=1 Tax=Paenibacillus sp. J2TS4 TaxID=2807194 RepID=UPI001B11D428|nr:hypothetical protein [Paenibacillus sp. J2TS4]GIP35694.1 hypothetical protein J2TS4_49040 [Paenibacillus sp. J2TS4]
MLLLEVQRPLKRVSEAELKQREEVIRRLKQNYRGLFSVHKEFLYQAQPGQGQRKSTTDT